MNNKNLRISDSIFKTEIGDSIVILETNTGKYLELNETASFIFDELEKKNDFSEIIRNLVEIYEVDIETAKESLDNFILECLKNNILIQSSDK